MCYPAQIGLAAMSLVDSSIKSNPSTVFSVVVKRAKSSVSSSGPDEAINEELYLCLPFVNRKTAVMLTTDG
ncbi:MAG: hypothetical protein JWR22_3383 [Herminiimonas sp.]|nr:hypothetical protein [Herminiimonas sp.]